MTIVPPFVLRYRVEQERVLILRIRHGAREPDDEFAGPESP
jgi:plasmid stabilization system protein ParE